VTESEYPRVLVVTTNNFNLVGGGGITLTNLFRGWPSDRIANLHEDSTAQDHTVCRNSFKLTRNEIRLAWPFSILNFVAAPQETGTGALGLNGRSPLIALSRLVVGDGMPRTFRLTPRLEKWLDEFSPDLIYSFLGSMAQIRLTSEVSRVRNIPIALHMMDDWPSVLYRRGIFGPVLRRIIQREFHGILKHAVLRMGISETMCAEYARRYGYAFQTFHNTLDVDDWLATSRRAWTAATVFRVFYVGSIVPDAQQKALRDICVAIRELRRSGVQIEFHIRSPRAQSAYLRSDSVAEDVCFGDPPGNSEIGQVLAEADALVLPFDFDQHSAAYMALSMPTKVPAYMISGTPILVYGPSDLGIVDFAGRNHWAEVVSIRDSSHLQTALRRLVTEEAYRERLGRQAVTLARELYDSRRVRPAFHSALASAAKLPTQ
jgi:glycosyltransferase involved in cell wall biosynthesis